MTFIPFNRPSISEKALVYMQKAALENGHISGDGAFTRQAEKILQELIGAKRVLLTSSCTHALEMAALLLDIQAGDEVIVPSFTFVSTINAFVLRGAKPVFADIRPDTLNLDERLLPDLISERTKAIVPVHYAGVACEMDSILEQALKHDIAVVEDNAHGLFGKYKGRPLGGLGQLSTQSFHETKNITSGEGGALVINDDRLVERAEIIREKGTNRSRFFRGQVDKYTWVDIGSSYLMSDMLAGYLVAQLEEAEAIQTKRQSIWTTYYQQLEQWATTHAVQLPFVPQSAEQAYHMFYLLMPSLDSRTAFIEHMKAHQILAVFHYLPLHLSEMGERIGTTHHDCPVTVDISERLVRLPFYNSMSIEDQERVIEVVQAFRVG